MGTPWEALTPEVRRKLEETRALVRKLRDMDRRPVPMPKPGTIDELVKFKWPVMGPWYSRGGKCSLPEVCAYLRELGAWLQQHHERGNLERKAICNLESLLYRGYGLDAPVLCKDDGTDPPGEEPPPTDGA